MAADAAKTSMMIVDTMQDGSVSATRALVMADGALEAVRVVTTDVGIETAQSECDDGLQQVQDDHRPR